MGLENALIHSYFYLLIRLKSTKSAGILGNTASSSVAEDFQRTDTYIIH